jgi:hypothetical protein
MGDHLSEKIDQYRAALKRTGCLEGHFPSPNIRNAIHPMFHRDRWMRGDGQMTREMYDRANPALRLASLMITEDCHMWWWAHLHHGREVKTHLGHYLQESAEEYSPQGRQAAREGLRKMANVITFLFTPKKYRNTREGKAWG